AGQTAWRENRHQHRFPPHFAHGENALRNSAGAAGLAQEGRCTEYLACCEVCPGHEECLVARGDGRAVVGKSLPTPQAIPFLFLVTNLGVPPELKCSQWDTDIETLRLWTPCCSFQAALDRRPATPAIRPDRRPV